MSLEALFDASLNPDPALRAQAEGVLSTSVSPLQLIHFVGSTTNHAQRLGALVYLKNYILHHWSAQFAEFKGTLCSDDDRHVLRHECFKLLGDAEKAVRLQAGFIVSKMIASDYPEDWATVLDDLISILAKPPTASWLQGSLVVMKGELGEHSSMIPNSCRFRG